RRAAGSLISPARAPTRAVATAVPDEDRVVSDTAGSTAHTRSPHRRVAPRSQDAGFLLPRRRRAGPQPSRVFSQQLLEDLVVERLAGHQLLQPPVLVLEGLEPSRVTDVHAGVLALPPI